MTNASPLPDFLVQRYHAQKAAMSDDTKARLLKLADGQEPPAMVISCCDSRVHATALFGAEQGEFFMHRNIANFVPAADATGENTGTAAALEYAITALKVKHIVVMGHSKCGGVKGYHDMCKGHAPSLEDEASFVGRWIRHLAPALERIGGVEAGREDVDLEKAGVMQSLDNLMTYSFVRDGVEAGTLTLHGLWMDISNGDVQALNAETGAFEAL
jgi:carbonic anhydrase